MKKTLFATVAMASLFGPLAFSAQKSSNRAPAAPARPAVTTSAGAPASTAALSKPADATMHDLHGRIVSMSDTSLVASVGQGSKAKDTTFMLNADTKTAGKLIAGEMVRIEYWEHGSDKIAASVQVQPLKTTAQSKPSKSSY